MAEDEGRFDEAVAHYEQAHELSGNNYFANLAAAARVRAAAAPTEEETPDAPPDEAAPPPVAATDDPPGTQAEDGAGSDDGAGADDGAETLPSLADLGDAMIFHPSYTEVFQRRSEAYADAERHAEAAADLESLLLFTEDVLERARLLRRAADQWRLGGRHAEARSAYARAMEHLAAKPFTYEMLRLGHDDSLPSLIAAGWSDTWRAEGRGPGAIRRAAWSLPWIHSPRAGPTLFRMALARFNGPADVLLRESELALMAEPGHMIALWERMYALEALGRHAALPGAMRDIIESYPQGSGVRLFENQVARMQADEELQRDPEAFFALGLADLLRGRFRESAGLFQQGLVFVDEASDPHPAARLLAWQARALLLSGLDDAGPRCKALLQRAVALTPDDPLLNLRLETMP